MLLLVVWGAAPQPPAGLWGVADRLDSWGPGRAGTGWRFRVTLVAREAVAGESETEVRMGWLGTRGFGFDLAGARITSEEGLGGGFVEAAAVVRRGSTRVTGSGQVWRWGSERRLAWAGRVEHTPAPVLWLSAAVSGASGSAPLVDLRLLAGGVPWAVEARVRDGAWSYGVEWMARTTLAVQLRMRGANPELGLSWRFGSAEVRARRAGHPFLGSVSTACLSWGGLAP